MGDELKWQISDDYRFATCLDHKMVDNLGQINKYGAFLLILLMVCSIFNIVFYTIYVNCIKCAASNICLSLLYVQIVKKLIKIVEKQKVTNNTANDVETGACEI